MNRDLNFYNYFSLYKLLLKMSKFDLKSLSVSDVSRVIEMAWEDRTPFEAIQNTFGLAQAQVIILMRQNLKRGSFKLWRERVAGRATKHLALRSTEISRAYCATQYKVR